MLRMLLESPTSFNAGCVGVNQWEIRLSNGTVISAESEVERNGGIWAWRIQGQYFDREEHARRYLETLIAEKSTGKRVILHAKRKPPEICGVEGRACRAPNECRRALCFQCPVAEEFFAKRDGVELIYAMNEGE